MKRTSRNVVSSYAPAILTAAFFVAQAPMAPAQNVDTWTGGDAPGNVNFSDPNNWGGTAPNPGDTLLFPGGATANNDYAGGSTNFGGIFYVGGGSFSLTGNPILLSGQTNGDSVGLISFAGTLTATANLNLDWGYYTFLAAGSSLQLNDALNPGSNGVAVFSTGSSYANGNITSSTFTTDPSGLIQGLGGQGLIGTNGNYVGNNTFTNQIFSGGVAPIALATVSSGQIIPYTWTGGNTIASGAIPSGANNNILLNKTGGSLTFTAASGTAANTITANQAGNSGGTQTTTLSITGAGGLVLGNNGGLYEFSSAAGTKSVFTVSGGYVTAGTSGPATLVFGTVGNNANNQTTISSQITNNAGGGPVTCVITGPGSILFGTSTSNYYTGGTYVTEGQLQVGKTNGAGVGPIYVAQNASLYFQNAGIYPNNNFFLSPGNGSPTAAAVANGGSLLYAISTGVTNGGVITLMGNPNITAPGDRITGDGSGTLVFTNQITGSGTLEFFDGGAFTEYVELRNATANPNNWQGGMIIDSANTSAQLSVRVANNNIIPNGANAGNLTIIAPGSTAGKYNRFDLNGKNATINGLNAPSGNNVNQLVGNFQGSGPSVLALGAGNASGDFYGELEDQGGANTLSLIKIGTGTQILEESNTYVGTTTVSNGTLALGTAGYIATSPTVYINNIGTLSASSTLTIPATQTINSIGTVAGNTVVNGKISSLSGTLGVFTNSGNMTFNGGGGFVWNINSANGAPGVGSGQVQITSGNLTINATTGNPFTIYVTGSPSDFNPANTYSWPIVVTPGSVSLTAGQVAVNDSAFTPPAGLGSGNFSVEVTPASPNNLTLIWSPTAEIPPSGELVNSTNVAGTTASFTVTASGAQLPCTFQWYQGSNPNPLEDYPAGYDPANPGGATITITSSGDTSTLTLGGTGVEDPDAGGYTVEVTDGNGNTAESSATLTVIDPLMGPSITESGTQTNAVYSGAYTVLTATAASGTMPYSYIWLLNGQAIGGATGSTLPIDISQATAGSYTVIISNYAGSVTDTTATIIAPVTTVPNQILFEPFYYPVFDPARGGSPSVSWTGLGVTNNYNQMTGVPIAWIETGANLDYRTRTPDEMLDPASDGFASPAQNLATDEYPVEGLASGYTWQGPNSPIMDSAVTSGEYGWGFNPGGTYGATVSTNAGLPGSDPVLYTTSDKNGNQIDLPFGTGGTITSGTLYCSMVVSLESFSTASYTTDYFCGFGNPASSTTQTASLYIQGQGTGSSPVPYTLGIFKGNLTASTLNPGVNGAWAPITMNPYEIYFVVFRIVINPLGGSTCDMWINPPTSSYFASEANLPTPTVAGVAGSAPDQPGGVSFFYSKITTYPVSRDMTDLRIGTTWASVTPPSAPTLLMSPSISATGSSTNVVLSTVNAGNPVSGPYAWTFNNGTGPVTLSDGMLADNAQIHGSATGTLTIINPTLAEAGTYTIIGTNTSPAPSDSPYLGLGPAILTGTASVVWPPPLTVSPVVAGNSVVSWQNWNGYTLEESPSLQNPSWTVIGTNNPAVISTGSGTQFYKLVAPLP